MSYSQLILKDSAEIVWPLDDITPSSSITKSINFINRSLFSYSASINTSATDVFNTPITFGGGKALNFTASSIGLSIPAIGRFSELYSNKDSVISFWFQTSILSSIERPIFKKRGNNNVGLFIKDNYFILKYGNSSEYTEVKADIVDFDEPHHIIASKTKTGLSLIVDGKSYSTSKIGVELSKDNNHSSNDYLDFYGPAQSGWIIDSIALFPNALSEQVSKRHYVYGLGKNVSDDVFYSRGGNLYNFSTGATERLGDINWDYPDEWNITELVDLYLDSEGIRPLSFPQPTFYSSDNNIQTASNRIKFSASSQVTQASYIEINNLSDKIGGGEYPLFVKLKLDGTLPAPYLSQRLFTYGVFPENEIIKFDLFNTSASYVIKVSTITSASLQFPITNPISASNMYIGMSFSSLTKIYFAEQGKSILTSSFSYLSASGYGLDPLISYFPPRRDLVIRIGSSLNYDNTNFSSDVYGIDQFYGTFEKVLVTQTNFVASANYSYLDSYNTPRYDLTYNSDEKRFNIKTYGYGNFNIHCIDISEYIDDDEQFIGSNIVKFGYPDIQSSSQVYLYATLYNYSGSVVYPKTRINQNNYLNFINNRNVVNSYLRFDFEILANNSSYYPPRIKYFQMQTFKSASGRSVMRDDAGPNYTLYQTSSSVVYVPEIRYTPTAFMTNNSGIKLDKTIADFTENILAKPLDPTIIDGLQVWLDARFVNGLNKDNPNDDSRVLSWTDLSDSRNNATTISASAPIYRAQALNLLRVNQSTGSDTEDLDFILPTNVTIKSSPDGVVSGTRGIELTPTASSNDSYIDISFNTASFSTFPSQTYSVVGSIKLLKPQTSSALNANARKIAIYNTSTGSPIFTASSIASTNAAGTYSLSALFTTSSATVRSNIRLYNGSSNPQDIVYWDNIGLYAQTSGSYISSWIPPLSFNDRPTMKFNGSTMVFNTSASSAHPSSLYLVGRNFGDSTFIESGTASILFYTNQEYYVSYGSPQVYPNSSNRDNKFKIFSILDDASTTDLYINGQLIASKNAGSSSINRLIIGRRLRGDIAAVLLYNGKHSTENRQKIETWLNESFDVF